MDQSLAIWVTKFKQNASRGAQDGPKMATGWPQDGLKRDLWAPWTPQSARKPGLAGETESESIGASYFHLMN